METDYESKVDDWEVHGPPWIRPGGFRRDGKPEYGARLARFGHFSHVCGMVACGGFAVGLLLWVFLLMDRFGRGPDLNLLILCSMGTPLAVLVSLAGLPTGVVVWFVARRHRSEMLRGERDPSGLILTEQAFFHAHRANFLNAICPGLAVLNLFLVFWVVISNLN